MTHDDVIRLARQVADPDTTDPLCGGDQRDLITLNLDEMVRFAALVAAKCGECGKSAAKGWALYCVQCCEDSMVKAAVAEEREACALLCDKRAADYRMGFEEKYEAQACAYDIRARGEEPKRHPGYIIGDHWLQAAYTRVCTGETEAEVMGDYGWQRESR